MENASKALVMAGGVLIGVLLMSLAVYLFVSFGGETAKVYDRNAEQQIVAFNTEYTQYEGKEDITVYDILSVKNKAEEYNAYYNLMLEDDEYISVKIPSGCNLEDLSNDNNYKITTTTRELKTFKCEIIEYSASGKVKTIKFY